VTRAEFDERVRRLEAAARDHPALYRLRVVVLALLGYGYIALVLAGLLALTGAALVLAASGRGVALFVKVLLALAPLLVVVVRSFWVRLAPPTGRALGAGELPALFATIERVRSRLRAPRVDCVLLDANLNAGVVQVPRLGILGWPRNFLILGLPLLQALPPREFEAVLAHEFGHLSGTHGGLGGWIYRIRAGWQRLAAALDAQEHWGRFLFRRFFRWYAPFFASYSFVLARAREYEADRSAAQLVGPRSAADALLRLRLADAALQQRFWPGVYREADHSASPTPSPYLAMAGLGSAFAPGDAEGWLAPELRRPTTNDDTHPSLADRLAALGEAPRVPPAPGETAAERLLGPALPALAAAIDAEWRRSVESWWTQRFRYVSEAKPRLRELEARAARGPLSLTEAWDRARFTEEFRDADAAFPLYAELAAAHPDFAPGRFAYGRLLLQRQDPGGLEHLDRAMDRDGEAILPACELACAFLSARGLEERAAPYRERALERQEILREAQEERAKLELRAIYLPHGLEREALDALRSQLAARPEVRRAFLVRKAVRHFPERPLFVLGVERAGPWYGRLIGRGNAALQSALARELELPGECFVLVLNGRRRRERRIVTGVAGSRIVPAAR
jgi:Zn-dependent protease with chaperone function